MNDDQFQATWLLYIVGKLQDDDRALYIFVNLMMAARADERERQAGFIHQWTENSGGIGYGDETDRRVSREVAAYIEREMRRGDDMTAESALQARIREVLAVLEGAS